MGRVVGMLQPTSMTPTRPTVRDGRGGLSWGREDSQLIGTTQTLPTVREARRWLAREDSQRTGTIPTRPTSREPKVAMDAPWVREEASPPTATTPTLPTLRKAARGRRRTATLRRTT